ncbi:MAG: hypothetical protein ACT4OZ_00985 [Gemmatimonadota bacterium]
MDGGSSSVVALFTERRNIDLVGIANNLHAVLAQHGESAVVRFPGLDGAETKTPEHLDAEIERLSSRFSVTLVGVRGPFMREALVAFDRARKSLVFTDGSVPSAREVRRILRLTSSLGLGVDRVFVVLVEGETGGLDAEGVSSAVQRDLLAVIPLPSAGSAGRRAAYTRIARFLVQSECVVAG